jgi:hypothetical protein
MTVTPEAGNANELYWQSNASVAEIAARFDLSRRALYEAIRPLPADAACPACGGGLMFENRLARRTGQGVCDACGERRFLGLPAVAPGNDATPRQDRASARNDLRAWGEDADDRSADLRHKAVLLGGAAIAGLAIGTVAALWSRRRD